MKLRGGLIALLLAAAAAHADDTIPECRQYERLQYPAADQPTAEQAKELANCLPSRLYYGGPGVKADYVKARHCAFITPDQAGQPSKGVLMMLYANGEGVARNYELAKKASCETWAAPAEAEGRLRHLERMQQGAAGTKPRIDLCDDITSGMMGGYCASLQSDREQQRRDKWFGKLTAKWNKDSLDALTRLQAKATVFFEARSSGEVDQSGSARAAFVIGEEEKMREDFLRSLRAFEAGKLPAASAAELAQADRELNEVYQQLKRSQDPQYGGAVKMANIQSAQRAWLAYRDEWVKFGKVKYPAVPDYAWQAYFTKKRTAMLKEWLSGRD